MSAFKVAVVAVNPKDEQAYSEPVDALVDTGSELTWLPHEILTDIGVEPRRKRVFVTADGKRITRQLGYAVLRAGGFETVDEVVFAEKGDMTLLGVRTIEGFSVTVDSIGHRLVARATLACPAGGVSPPIGTNPAFQGQATELPVAGKRLCSEIPKGIISFGGVRGGAPLSLPLIPSSVFHL